MRIDLLLVEIGLAPSRTRAQEMIEKGVVFIRQGETKLLIKKPSFSVTEQQRENIEIELSAELSTSSYVSRGGIKMQGALKRLQLDVTQFRVLDVGISTGGFSDCLLQSGAASIVGIDVGRGQLAEKLKTDARVQAREGINARQLSEPEVKRTIIELNQDQPFDLVVVDVSFISLTLVLPSLIQYLNEGALLLALVKPQFEVGREGLGKNGIVKDASLYRLVEEKIQQKCDQLGLKVEDYFESSIEGTDGNREFFVYATAKNCGASVALHRDDTSGL